MAYKTAAARHILVKTREEAEQIRQRLLRGEDFGTLARRYSTCPSGKKGGDLGEFRRGQMAKPVDDVVFRKPELEIHGPVKSRFGYHLIQTIYRK